MHYTINYKGNSKTGNIPVTTSGKQTCPDSCPLKESGCYAKYSFLGAYWNKVTEGTAKNLLDFKGLLQAIKNLPNGQLWRMNQAGDLPHVNGTIVKSKAYLIAQANKGRKGFTYTHHKPEIGNNKRTIKHLNDLGFTINLSANSLQEADNYIDLKIAPVVTLLPVNADKVSYTPKGVKVVKCPANKDKGITCATCQLCAIHDRDYIIGFPAHGTAKKKVELIAVSSN